MPANKAPHLSAWTARTLLLAASVSLSLVLCEGLLFLADSGFQTSSSVEDGRYIDTVRRGPAGSRGPRVVLSYGDSIGHAYDVAWELGYPMRLERLLDGNPEGTRFQVATPRGYSPSTYAARLLEDLRRLDPDIVLVEIELSNDTSDEAFLSWEPDPDGLPRSVVGGRYIQTWDGRGLVTAVTGSGPLERTRFYTLLLKAVGALWSQYRPNPVFSKLSDTYYYNIGWDRAYLSQSRLDEGFARMFRALSSMNEACRRRDVPFLLLISPSRYLFRNGRFRAGADRLMARAASQAQALRIPYFSLEPAMRRAGGDRLFMDFCHPNVAGHEVIATAILPEVVAGLRGTRSSRPAGGGDPSVQTPPRARGEPRARQ